MMIAISHKVKIIPSDELAAMHLSGMVGRKGKVVEQIFSTRGGLIGYMVCLNKSFQGECLWFIPITSDNPYVEIGYSDYIIIKNNDR